MPIPTNIILLFIIAVSGLLMAHWSAVVTLYGRFKDGWVNISRDSQVSLIWCLVGVLVLALYGLGWWV